MSKRQDVFLLEASGTSLGASGEVAFTVFSPTTDTTKFGTVSVYQITISRSAGTGATIQPRVLGATGSSNTIDEAWLDTGAPSAVGSVYNKQFPEPGLQVKCDVNGKMYVVPGFDAGADNACTVRVWFAHGRHVGV